MLEIETNIRVRIKQDGEILQETNCSNNDHQGEGDAAAGHREGEEDQERDMSEEEDDRYVVASDLANVCEYLEDSEVIKIRLIVSKAQKRKEREESAV